MEPDLVTRMIACALPKLRYGLIALVEASLGAPLQSASILAQLEHNPQGNPSSFMSYVGSTYFLMIPSVWGVTNLSAADPDSFQQTEQTTCGKKWELKFDSKNLRSQKRI